MNVRALSLATLAVCGIAGVAKATPDMSSMSGRPAMSVSSSQASLATYRQYVKEQANTLVGMTRVLVKAIDHGDVDAAQSTYAPAHRYFKRIEPIARVLNGLDKRMDSRADAHAKGESDAAFSGFHRLEHGLFARRSVENLSSHADRLQRDARALREDVSHIDITPAVLLDETAKLVRDMAAKRLGGAEERYSRTDFWDVEANIDGVREVMAMVRPHVQARDAQLVERTAIHFATIDGLLEKQKAGCGFRNFDEASQEDKLALKAAVSDLADELSRMRGALALN